MSLELAIDREWGREPGWLGSLSPELAELVIADHMHRHGLELRGVRRRRRAGAA